MNFESFVVDSATSFVVLPFVKRRGFIFLCCCAPGAKVGGRLIIFKEDINHVYSADCSVKQRLKQRPLRESNPRPSRCFI